MALEKQPGGPTTLEIVDRLKRTVELHRGQNTWVAFQNEEFERMEQTIPGYGKYVKMLLDDAPEEDRDRLFEFAYTAYELPEMRLGAGRAAPQEAEGRWWAGTDLRLQASVLEDTFGIQPHDNPKVMEQVGERVSLQVPGLGDYARDYLESMQLSPQATIDAAILVFVVSEIVRSRCDPAYENEPVQMLL
jgi:hypothetical protein